MPTPSKYPLEYLKRASVIIVTGGSSGIGCSIIKAIKKLDPSSVICNLSRSKPDDFSGKNDVHVSTDLTRPEAIVAAVEKLREIIQSAPPGEVLLFNNSGFGDYGRMQDIDLDKQLSMIDLNVRSVVDLTVRLLPLMRPRGGVIINIASVAGFQPTPFMVTYGASKAFVLHWSLALNEDLRGTGLRTLTVCPGPTASNFFKAAGFEKPPMGSGSQKGLHMTAEAVAEQTLYALALGRSLVVNGWKNKIVAFFGGTTPKRLVTRIGGVILRKMRLEQHKGKGTR